MSAGSLAKFSITFPIREAVECIGGPLDGARVVVNSSQVSAFLWNAGYYLRRVKYTKTKRTETHDCNGMPYVQTVTSLVPSVFYEWHTSVCVVSSVPQSAIEVLP